MNPTQRFLPYAYPSVSLRRLLAVCLSWQMMVGLGIADGPTVDIPPDRTPILMIDGDGFAGGPVKTLDISNDGRYLAAANDAVVRVYDLTSGSLFATFRGYQEGNGAAIGSVTQVAFSPGGGYLVIGVKDNTEFGSTRVIDLQDPEKLHQLVTGHLGCTSVLAFSPDGKYLSTSGCDINQYVYRWNERTGRASMLYEVEGVKQTTQRSADFIGENRSQSSSTENYKKLFPNSDGNARLDENGDRILDKNGDEILVPSLIGANAEFSSDGRYLFAGYKQVVWSLEEERALNNTSSISKSLRDRGKLLDGLQNEGFDRIGRHLVAAETEPSVDSPLFASALVSQGKEPVFRVAVWNYGDTQPASLYPVGYFVTAIGWNIKSQHIAAADQLGRISVWRLGEKKRRQSIRSGSKLVWNVLWSEDGKKLRFADVNYPSGHFHYNRFGGVTHEFDTSRLILRPRTSLVNDRSLGIMTSQGTVSVRNTSLQVRLPSGDFEELTPGQHTRLTRSVSNVNGVLRPDFGQLMCFEVFKPSLQKDEHIVVGSGAGNLVEGIIDRDDQGVRFLRPLRYFLGHTATVTSIAVSPDKSLLASSSLDGTIRVWSLQPPRVIGDLDITTIGSSVLGYQGSSLASDAGLKRGDRLIRFGQSTFFGRMRELVAGKYHPGDIVDIEAVNYKGEKRVVPVELAASPDYAVPLWSLFVDRDDEWVAWTKEGYYAASSNGAKHIGWHVNNERHEAANFYSVDQFGTHLHQRQIVIDTLKLGSSEKAADLVLAELEDRPKPPRRIDADSFESFQTTLPPVVSNVSYERASPGDVEVSVTFTVKQSTEKALRKIQVFVNGRRAEGQPEQIRQDTQDGVVMTQFRHRFIQDRVISHLSVQAIDVDGMQDTCVANLIDNMPSVLVSSGDSDQAKIEDERRLYVLAIGVSDYRNTSLTLQYAADDARSFANVWQDQEGVVFDSVVAKTIVNEEATADAIEDGLHWLSRQAIRRDDLAIVFLSGHGLVDRDGDWYFASTECETAKLYKTAISHDRLEHQLGKVRANLIVFTDTCHAGSMSSTRGSKSVASGVRGTSLWRGSGTLTYAACLPEEQSFENDAWGHGAFTHAVIEFLREGKDYNGDGWLEFSEMETYVNHRVSTLTGDQQHPDAHKPPGVGSTFLTKSTEER